jgi:site-specific DNA-methyltransferase (adenine-specific)
MNGEFSLHLGDACYNNQDTDRIRLLWTDPPYGTGKQRKGGRGDFSYYDGGDIDHTTDCILSWLPHLHKDATIVVCCDYRLAPDLTSLIKKAGWEYRGEIIWEFGLGRPRENWWPVRHNNLLTFTSGPDSGRFDFSAIPTTRRLSPQYGYPNTKPCGSVWDFTMSNTHPDRVHYPNQKPVELILPFVRAHTCEGDTVLDIFCGSSSTGMAALLAGRNYMGVDNNPQAIDISRQRLCKFENMLF